MIIEKWIPERNLETPPILWRVPSGLLVDVYPNTTSQSDLDIFRFININDIHAFYKSHTF